MRNMYENSLLARKFSKTDCIFIMKKWDLFYFWKKSSRLIPFQVENFIWIRFWTFKLVLVALLHLLILIIFLSSPLFLMMELPAQCERAFPFPPFAGGISHASMAHLRDESCMRRPIKNLLIILMKSQSNRYVGGQENQWRTRTSYARSVCRHKVEKYSMISQRIDIT